MLPAMVASGVAIARGRPVGLLAGPVLLGFAALTAAALIGMAVASNARGLGSDAAPLVLGALIGVGASVALLRLLIAIEIGAATAARARPRRPEG